jgi:glycosyltransferase involved in cell wall biosynthesis
MTSVAIVTPSIGSHTLQKCIESIKNQTYKNFVHHIFVDGKQNLEEIKNITSKYDYPHRLNIIEENVGKGWYGHRVYAACSFLVNQDAIIYLDEDNWLETNHVESMVEKINSSNFWAYSLRKIFDKDGNYFCDDDCESLGKWPTYFNEDVHHIDTSCFIVKKQVALSIGHSWYAQWGADRQFFNALKQYFPNFSCTGKYSLCYRLGGNDGSVQKDFFIKGNQKQIEKYLSKENFPWLKMRSEVGPGISIQM